MSEAKTADYVLMKNDQPSHIIAIEGDTPTPTRNIYWCLHDGKKFYSPSFLISLDDKKTTFKDSKGNLHISIAQLLEPTADAKTLAKSTLISLGHQSTLKSVGTVEKQRKELKQKEADLEGKEDNISKKTLANIKTVLKALDTIAPPPLTPESLTAILKEKGWFPAGSVIVMSNAKNELYEAITTHVNKNHESHKINPGDLVTNEPVKTLDTLIKYIDEFTSYVYVEIEIPEDAQEGVLQMNKIPDTQKSPLIEKSSPLTPRTQTQLDEEKKKHQEEFDALVKAATEIRFTM